MTEAAGNDLSDCLAGGCLNCSSRGGGNGICKLSELLRWGVFGTCWTGFSAPIECVSGVGVCRLGGTSREHVDNEV